MANPQKEEGHIQIATGIWEALVRTRVPGEARQVLDFVIRKTYGFNKKEDWIPLSQFCEATGINKPHIVRATAILIKMGLITQKGNGRGITYSFQKDYDKWAPLPKKVTLPKKAIIVTQKGNSSLPKKAPSINNTSIDNTKDNIDAVPASPQPVLPKKAKELTDLQRVVLVYKIVTGHDREDKDWDKLNFRRCSKSAKQLLDYFKDWKKAGECIEWWAEKMEQKELDWTLETVVKHASEYKLLLQQQEMGVRIGAI